MQVVLFHVMTIIQRSSSNDFFVDFAVVVRVENKTTDGICKVRDKALSRVDLTKVNVVSQDEIAV